MSQKSGTTTTSFIVSSNESLNKPQSTSSQSADSCGEGSAHVSATNDSIRAYDYNSMANSGELGNMAMNQRHSIISTSSGCSNSAQHILSTRNNQLYQVQNCSTISDHSSKSNGVTVSNACTPNQPFNLPQSLNSNNSLTHSNGQQPIYGGIYGTNGIGGNNNNNGTQVPTAFSTPQIALPLGSQRAYLANGSNFIQQNQNNLIHHHQDEKNELPTSQTLGRTIQSFHIQKNHTSQQYSPISSSDSTSSASLMPINVKGMLLHGVADSEIIRSWLIGIKCEDLVKNFLNNGYDMPLLVHATPQDLAALGCKTLALRQKILAEIKKLNLEDDIPNFRPHSLEKWLELLKLSEYHTQLCNEGYDTIDKVCELTEWEDLEDIGITKLGHQKRLLLGIRRIKNFDKQQEERQHDNSIYDIHPNHRISLNANGATINRASVRSGFFQTRSGANLDHRGLPIATVMPALKHVNSALANLDISQQTINTSDLGRTGSPTSNAPQEVGRSEQTFKMSDLTTTLKRNPPPLPPVRTNSLKTPIINSTFDHDMSNGTNIYGNSKNPNNYGLSGLNNHSGAPINSTSFLRTPKLGTLTATTNKMLTLGGHIQSIHQPSVSTRPLFPVREAPLPPVPLQSTVIPEAIDEGNAITMQCFAPPQTSMGPSIEHQLASADEFPPPPPS